MNIEFKFRFNKILAFFIKIDLFSSLFGAVIGDPSDGAGPIPPVDFTAGLLENRQALAGFDLFLPDLAIHALNLLLP